MRSDKLEAIELRKSGFTYSQISDKLGVAKSTLSVWLKDLIIDESSANKIRSHIFSTRISKLIERNKERSLITKEGHARIRSQAFLEASKYYKDPLFITGLALYWGEGYKKGALGSKWKSIDFTNADPSMIVVILKFFRKYLPIQNSDITIQVMLHSPKDEKACIEYWKSVTGLDRTSFIKTCFVISKSSKKIVKSKLANGTIHVRINNVKHFFRLIGWIDFLKKKMED